MFGKIFASLYTGSLIGAGPVPFALMPYIISNAVPDSKVGGHVELNPKLLGTIFGCSAEEVEKAIELFCSPDPESRTPDEEGRRLVRLGPYDYRVVNYAKYRKIRDEEERREQNREAQAAFRARRAERLARAQKRKNGKGVPLPGEAEYVKALEEGKGEEAQKILDNQPGLPEAPPVNPGWEPPA